MIFAWQLDELHRLAGVEQGALHAPALAERHDSIVACVDEQHGSLHALDMSRGSVHQHSEWR